MTDKRQPLTGPEATGLLAVLLLAFALRLQHLDTLLPWFTYEDETRTTSVTLQLLRDWTIKPEHSFYPALSFYINALFYWLWAAPGCLGEILRHGPSAAVRAFDGLAPDSPAVIMLSRWVSLLAGLGAIVWSYLLFRLYLHWRWALFGALLVALNPVAVSMGASAKVDSLYLFWFAAGYYLMARYMRDGGLGVMIIAAACAGFGTVTKNNYQLPVALALVFLARNLGRVPRVRDLFFLRDFWAMAAGGALAGFIGSPWSFINFRNTLTIAGWLYVQAEVISTYHTDPHVWWLDRYYYLASIVMPFVFGLPVFWAAVAGTVHHMRKYARRDLVISVNLIWYIYIFASASGGPTGGAFPYYLFLISLPLIVFVVIDLIADLAASARRPARALGYALAAVVLATSLARVNAFHDMFFAPYDRLGPWLRGHVARGEKGLLVSVYLPGPGLADLDLVSRWPHTLSDDQLRQLDPHLVVVDDWAVAGFRKVYRDQPVAPLIDSLERKQGYHRVWETRADYFGRAYYAALDPEHDVGLRVLARGPKETK